MRVHISVDMEGVAGVATLDQTIRGGSGYPRAQALMTGEANAAIRGAFAGGATEVVVSDSHGTMDNLLHADLDARATLVFGSPRPSCMVHGLTRDDDLAVFVGYHAAAGAEGVLAHTFSASFTQVRVNGLSVSEADVNGLYAASLGVPVGVLTGDDRICAEVDNAFPGVVTVPVKTAEGWSAAHTLSPSVACEVIEATVAGAVADPRARPLLVPETLELEVDFAVPQMAEHALSVPGSVRVGGLTVRREVRDAQELLGLVSNWYFLAGVTARQLAALAQRA